MRISTYLFLVTVAAAVFTTCSPNTEDNSRINQLEYENRQLLKDHELLQSRINAHEAVAGGALPEPDRAAILATFDRQQTCWNTGDIPCFMEGYWESDSLRFIGSRGLTYGYQQTLDNYLKSYPDAAAMGQLSFNILSIEALSPQAAFVIGKWHLARTAGDLQGHFTLLWRKIDGEWVIVADHSS